MGKKKKGANTALGQSLIRDRFKGKQVIQEGGSTSLMHTSDLDDGFDWSRLQSVTEQGNLDEFLATAELAGTEFTAEKLNVQVLTAVSNEAVVSVARRRELLKLQEENKHLLRIPRRPKWTKEWTAEQLQERERDTFLEWRRILAALQEDENLVLTPFEKNLEFWRQLWRVTERSHLVVQIVDARHPLLFRCPDLESYVKELGPSKQNILLINKADFLNDTQRRCWAAYLTAEKVDFAFFSAAIEAEKQEAEELAMEQELAAMPEEVDPELSGAYATILQKLQPGDAAQPEAGEAAGSSELGEAAPEEAASADEDRPRRAERASESTHRRWKESPWEILDSVELLELFHSLCAGADAESPTIGLVGYPNVGKSSTINALCHSKLVSVSATPGKTKHFQTIQLGDMTLCDCPGLVFPSFAITKSELVCNGILPIDQLRDVISPITHVCQTVSRDMLELQYGINIVRPSEDDPNPERPPTAYELLNAYSFMRGYMSSSGTPDLPRGARYILKDYVKGKLLYSMPPPRFDAEWDAWRAPELPTDWAQTARVSSTLGGSKYKPTYTDDVHDSFFKQDNVKAITKPVMKAAGIPEPKPGKQRKKHYNKNKKEKLRRVQKVKSLD